MFVFGPVPSRRLGQSLGVNSIPPPKECSYDCVYCQVGPTPEQSIDRRAFYAPEEVAQAVESKLAECRRAGAPVDYVTFVPDGEPTLDSNLGRAIDLVRPLGCKIAVITNATLIDRTDVQDDLLRADWVSLKLDAAEEDAWRSINRPHPALELTSMLDGMRAFAQAFDGTLTTETLLVRGINDDDESLEAVTDVLADLQPSVAYVAAPTRPPAETWVRAPEEAVLHRAYQIFARRLDSVEFLLGFAEEEFRATSDPAQALLSITAVHPMREEEALGYIEQMGAGRDVLDRLVAEGKLVCIAYEGRRFYVRRARDITDQAE
jgi:wyosine [tRNA(Phe)-imidazoG37] synthetase (radical SAM superfamily)